MAIDSPRSLLQALLAARTNAEVKSILDEMGDSADIGLDTAFGSLGLHWHAFGDNLSNVSSIGLGTKPGRSLTERLTNATDALLEDRVQPNVTTPTSARSAAKTWFGRPISGPDDGLFKWDYAGQDIDRRISVVLLPSGNDSAPTVDVVDDGIGIKPEQFPQTILSLQGGNKINKWYVIGAFGQGGASTLAFCEYALIISRYKDEPNICGFTLVRVLSLNETYKEDCFGYLGIRGQNGHVSVPFCDIGHEPLDLYPDTKDEKAPKLTKGTLVRHFTYKLTNLSGKLGPGTGNLYHYFHASLFDPLFPFRVYDLRDQNARQELIRGSRNRLMRLQESDADSRTEIKHYRPMEYVSPLGTQDSTVGIEYWVVLSQKKQKDGYTLRAQSNELFIETGYPIIGTLNGQTQGQLSAHLLREVELGMVSRHIVIHLDATNANSKIRRELFATSREGFKDGPVLEDLKAILRKMLEEDDNLYAIERELTERIAKREAETTSEEVRRQVTKLLVEAGLQLREEGPSFGQGGGERQPVHGHKRRPYVKPDPLPTLPFPQVTKFRIASPQNALHCRINDSETLLVETDADAEFDRRGLIGIRAEPPLMEQAAKAPLRGGRIRWRLRPKADAKAGDAGKVIVTITRPDGSHLEDEVPFEVLPAMEEKAKKEKGFIPPFHIVPINPYDNQEQWATAWPELDSSTVTTPALESVAYKPVNLNGIIHVFYSTVFGQFKAQSEKLKNDTPSLSELFRTNYEVWIGYHAILQEKGRNDGIEGLEMETLEGLLETDRVRVAQMQVKQALQTANLQHQAMRSKAAVES
jgi:hypothetical protein